jgi:DUF218 domain
MQLRSGNVSLARDTLDAFEEVPKYESLTLPFRTLFLRINNVSEAEVMNDFIRQSNPSIQIFMEDKALTTLHNFLYSKAIIEQTPILVDELTIFCDRARSLKVYCLSLIVFGDKKVNIKMLSRQEPLWVYFLQLPSTINHVLGAIIPSMEKRILVKKQQWIKKYR